MIEFIFPIESLPDGPAMAGAANAADLIVYDVPVTEPIMVADTGWYLSVFGGGVPPV